jgi:hypothetical protein
MATSETKAIAVMFGTKNKKIGGVIAVLLMKLSTTCRQG